MLINPAKRIRGEITIPGDKSISHRSIMFSSIANGSSTINNFLMGADCLDTINCFKSLGVNIEIKDEIVKVEGVGLRGLKKPSNRLYVGNSGTTIRLIPGILSGQNFSCEITGDASIEKRPMKRIIEPLTLMGAKIYGLKDNYFAPLHIEGTKLKGINYTMPVASAQVKSSILLASLYGEETTYIQETEKSRNHTELILKSMGADIEENGLIITSKPINRLYSQDFSIPGDISSAAFFIVLGSILKDGEILIKNVGLNETRTGIIDVIKNMGGNISISNERISSGEKTGDILVKSADLKAVEICGEIIPRLIDEIPIIAVAACFAEGTTIIRNAEELKVKETNRISAVVTELKKIGADIEETEDGMIIKGGKPLKGGNTESYHDHRMAMSMAIAGITSENGVTINNPECVSISFPEFFTLLDKVVER